MRSKQRGKDRRENRRNEIGGGDYGSQSCWRIKELTWEIKKAPPLNSQGAPIDEPFSSHRSPAEDHQPVSFIPSAACLTVHLLYLHRTANLNMKDNEKILKAQLASLLLFDLEDVGDVFEPLLDFDSEEDLLEYMCALLGGETEEIRVFTKNIIRFQQGQNLLAPDASNDGGKNVEKSVASNSNSFATEKPLPSETPKQSKKQREAMKIEQGKKEKKQQENIQRKREEDERNHRLEKQNKEQQLALQEFKRKHEEEKVHLELAKSVAKMSVTEDIPEQSQKESNEEEKIVMKPPPPPKKPEPVKEKVPATGKAKVICGCFGTTHKALTNCLHCGRISCIKEGYGYCPHCSHLIEQFAVTSNSGEEFDKAMLHKERLLKYDAESTQRTVVFDDQADYFQNSTSTWLTENEQHEARSKDEQRRKDLHTIKKHVLQIQF